MSRLEEGTRVWIVPTRFHDRRKPDTGTVVFERDQAGVSIPDDGHSAYVYLVHDTYAHPVHVLRRRVCLSEQEARDKTNYLADAYDRIKGQTYQPWLEDVWSDLTRHFSVTTPRHRTRVVPRVRERPPIRPRERTRS